MNDSHEFITLPPGASRTRPLQLEYLRIEPEKAAPDGPVMVFLHEGLGCIKLWRGFPAALCERLQWRGLIYSRFAYGASTPRPHGEPFPADYLEREARAVLPALLEALGIERPWLLGHSDGGSIALIAAASKTANAGENAAAAPPRYAGIITIAPHYCVEEICLAGIARARAAYEQGELRRQLAKYHLDVDSAFYGWCNTWLDPERRGWNIAPLLPAIPCPILAIQGKQDEYATLDQIEAIKRHAPHVELLAIDNCGHSPHLAHTAAVIDSIAAFIESGK